VLRFGGRGSFGIIIAEWLCSVHYICALFENKTPYKLTVKRILTLAQHCFCVVGVLIIGYGALAAQPTIQFERLNGPTGVEDITIDWETGIAFLSADDRRATRDDRPVQGALYLLDLDDPMASPRVASLTLPADFHPHGIGFFREANTGKARLFVINHPESGPSTVEVFDWDGVLLHHVETITNRALNSPNDIHAVSLTHFYFTNDHGARTSFGRFLEDFLRLRRANVYYFDGQNFSRKVRRLRYANGIQGSLDDRFLYVAHVFGKFMLAYERDSSTGNLRRLGKLRIGTGGDNIERATDGSLWLVQHTNLWKFMGHALDSAKLSPWRILRIRWDQPGNAAPQVQQLYQSKGEDISGASVAAPMGKRVLVGSVFEPHFLIGRIPDELLP
jgi:arylesterase/paraoxonase